MLYDAGQGTRSRPLADCESRQGAVDAKGNIVRHLCLHRSEPGRVHEAVALRISASFDPLKKNLNMRNERSVTAICLVTFLKIQ